MSARFYLDPGNFVYLSKTTAPFQDIFCKTFEDLGTTKSKVLVKNKETGGFDEKEIFRTYRSYGKTPAFNPGNAKSYMFSGREQKEICHEIPEHLELALRWAKLVDRRYNQMVVNLYRTGQEFIEDHRDCDANMVDDYSIMIVNFCPEPTGTRYLKFSCAERGCVLSLPLHHRAVVIFDQAVNQKYRHGVPPGGGPRVSLTFRMMKEDGQ